MFYDLGMYNIYNRNDLRNERIAKKWIDISFNILYLFF